MLREVKYNTKKEHIAVKENIQVLTADLSSKIDQHVNDNTAVTSELPGKMVQNKDETE